MRALLAAILGGAVLAGAAQADGKIFVPLPDFTALEGDSARAEGLLREAFMVNVLMMNCSGVTYTEEMSSLVIDSAYLLGYGVLDLTTDALETGYSTPAFDYLDTPNACHNAQARSDKLITVLEGYGGSVIAYADQDQAYLDWRALMDEIEN
ncbi:hypothetical protein BVG79_01803 [Ketogulonicigenium robustum]|uniref:Uncharacterized protein n=1 Tax=Ketogulonicigenium robustum TaxID=92947 RepID=A0A1W6P1I4_9RHOB|nr:hypothetical protein [Ketogulonicigenium robustum]ARO15147.1 hypothetical protein BVG79_01803 [Ketogulonicigenium robustum]